jgi:hypothetical protein
MSGPKHIADAAEGSINEILYPKGVPLAVQSTEAHAYLTYAIERYRPGATIYEKISNAEVDARIKVARGQIYAAWTICESPIERLLLPFLVFQDYGPRFRCPANVLVAEEPEAVDGTILILPQLKVRKSRFDFAVFGTWEGRSKTIAVECDGAEFHDPVADFHRDSFNEQELGITTVRASGSEIHTAPESVAARVGRQMADWAGAS